MYGSDFNGGDELMLYIPSAAVIIAVCVVIYMKSPKVEPDLKEQQTDQQNHSNS
jgi:hypothetical protein